GFGQDGRPGVNELELGLLADPAGRAHAGSQQDLASGVVRRTINLSCIHCCLPVASAALARHLWSSTNLAATLRHKFKSGQRNSAAQLEQSEGKKRAPCGALRYRVLRGF